MIKEFQVYYDSEGGRIFPYYLGFESLLSSQLTDFSNAINSQCQHNDSFSLSKYLDVSQETQFRKFRFYLDLFNNARSMLSFPIKVIRIIYSLLMVKAHNL